MRGVVVAMAVAVLVAAGCGGAPSQTYTVEEADRAFRGQGFHLLPLAPQQHPDFQGHRGSAFVPSDHERFMLAVTRFDREADQAWPDFDGKQDGDSFAARRANVAVFSDGGLSVADRQRLLQALAALPARGHRVLIARR